MIGLLPLLAWAEAPRVVLLTMDAGDDLFSKSGHAAICAMPASEDAPGSPCFNYGITDFSNPPKLIWDYARGDADFWVVVFKYTYVLDRYSNHYDRTVYAQDVPMPPGDAMALYEALQHDALPDYRHYRYHHFYDNCTTRIRDRLDEALHGALRKDADVPYPRSWRSFAEESLAGEPLLLAASTFAGRAADVHPTLYQAMARPEILRAEVRARLGPGAEPRRVYARQKPMPSGSHAAGRLLVAGLSITITGLLWALHRVRPRIAERAAPIVPGLLGLTLWTLAILSVQAELRWNEALLLLLPTDLLLVAPLPRWRNRYLAFRAGLTAVCLLLDAIGIFEQPLFTLATLLLPLLLAIRRDPAPPA